MTATLKQKKWLLREWEVVTPEGVFVVTYSGRGTGYESIRVDGLIVIKTTSIAWFVPKFEFQLGESPASIEVRVWPWLALRTVRLRVAGVLCYHEGYY